MVRLVRVALCPEVLVFKGSKEEVKKALRKRKIVIKVKYGQLHIYKRDVGDLFSDYYQTPGPDVYIIGNNFKKARNTLKEIKDLLSYVSEERFIYEYTEYNKTVRVFCNGYLARVTTTEPYGLAASVTEETFPCTACLLKYCPFKSTEVPL